MSFSARFVSPLRLALLKVSLLALALVSLLLPAAVSAQQTFTGGAIAVGRTQTGPSNGTITISSPTGSSIATLKIVLNGLTTDGTACTDGNCWSLLPTSFYLKAPNGGPKLVLLGGVGDGIDGDDRIDSGSGLVNATVTIQDGVSAAPNDTAISPQGGSFTYAPSSYFLGAGQTPPLGSTADFPQTDGSATLTSRFGGIGIANGDQWTLEIENGEGLTTPINISSWQMIVTYASTTPTSTAVSSSQNPAFTASPNNTVTLTATVSPASGPTGTVAFTDNGTTISGCGAVVLSGGVAHCSTTFAQGYHLIEAAYSGGGGFGQSSGSLTQLVEVHPTANGSNSWCNDASFSAPLNGTPIAYPAVINISGYSTGTTVGNVTLELKNVAQNVALNGEFLLVAPGGANNLDFLDSAFLSTTLGINLFISDSGSNTPNYGTPVNDDTYVPFDGDTQPFDSFPASNSPIVDTNIPLVPGTINFAAPHGKTNSMTLQQAFSGAPANGDWALYATASNGSDALTVGGWCITLDVNSGVGTTTSLSSTSQRASFGASVTLVATVTVQGTSTPVTSGTVEFKDETTGNVLASAAILSGSGIATVATSTLAEGDHKILASYSGTGSFNTSFATMYERIDHATAVSSVNSNTWQFCNAGAITLPEGTSGPETPNPSNVFVSNLPGTVNTATLTLNNFSILVGDQLDNTASLVVGPTGAALDFFSNTAGGTIEDEALAGNYTFADSASGLVPSGSGNLNPGTYKPTSYVGTDSGTDVFTADPGGFYTLPGSFGYSASRGTSTFANKFGGTNPDGTWSLYFNSPNANLNGTGAAGGWCLNLTENLPTVSVTKAHSGSFSQGQSNAAFTVVIDNNGTNGPTGDPTGTNPMKVTDTLNSAFTYSTFSGTNWSCSAVGQVVTCTNDSAIAEGSSYPTLTIDVNVSAGATGTVTNKVSVSGAGVSATSSNTDTVTIDVPPVFTSGASATFTVGTAGSFVVTASGTPAPTFSETGALPTGVTLTNTGTISGTPAAGTGGTYPITITAANGSNATQNFTLTVDQAPAITSANNTTFATGTAGSFTVIASAFPTATFSETGALPSGVTFSSAGLLSGTPGAGAGGTYPITITASNGVSPNATQSFTLTVNQAPVFTSASSTTFTVGAAGAFIVAASGNPAATFSETGALPSGVTLSSAGLLSGTPAAGTGGTYAITITAANGTNATQNFTLTVDQAPAITSANNTTFSVGTAGSFTATATGFPSPGFTETGALPTGVTFSSAGVLSGTPAAGSGGTYPITITASNGVGSNATQSFTLTVNQALAITSANNTTFTVGAAGTFTVTASGSPAPTFSETGALPSGVTLGSAGLLSGTPAAGSGGTYVITITASNGISPNATQNFTLTVDQAPAITSANSTTFTGGAAGSFTVIASGFPAPTFSETGALPTGVTLSASGVLSGTPGAGTGGTYPITITASNGVNPNATQSFTLTVSQTTATVTLSNLMQTYSGAPLSATATTVPTGLSVGLTYNSSSTAPTAAGSYAVVATVTSPGYTGTANGTLVIAKAPLTVTANNASMAVGAAVPAFTASYSGFVPGDSTAVLSGSPAYSTTATSSSPLGTYPITITQGTLTAANYTFTFVNGTLTVVQAPTVVLTTTATLAGSAGAGYTATVTVTNNGTGTASNVQLNSATLGSTTGSPLPQSLGAIAAGGSATVTVNFPGTAGSDGARAAETYAGTSSGGTFSASIRAVLP